MKKLLATAAVALAMTSNAAFADDIAWSGQTPGVLPGSTINYSGFLGALGYAGATGLLGTAGYNQSGSNSGNTQTASPTVTNTWLIKGNVTPDCSFYGGASTAHTLDFGTIGVHTESTTNVQTAFDMVSAATATVNTTTAGCNTNNTVKITKAAAGLVNDDAVGYDSNQFQANIPYTATAEFTATTSQNGGAIGGTQTVSAGQGASTATGTFGAWRSALKLTVNAPAPAKALVAGTYEDTMTVELKAL